MGTLMDRLDQMLAEMPSEEEETSASGEPCRLCDAPSTRFVSHGEGESGCSFPVCLSCGEHVMFHVEQMVAMQKAAAEAAGEVETEFQATLLTMLGGFLADENWVCKFCGSEVVFSSVRVVQTIEA